MGHRFWLVQFDNAATRQLDHYHDRSRVNKTSKVLNENGKMFPILPRELSIPMK